VQTEPVQIDPVLRQAERAPRVMAAHSVPVLVPVPAAVAVAVAVAVLAAVRAGFEQWRDGCPPRAMRPRA
jgi:hypothetical protein